MRQRSGMANTGGPGATAARFGHRGGEARFGQRGGAVMMPGGGGGGGGDDDPADTYVSTLGYEKPAGAAEKFGNSLKGLFLGPFVILLGCLLLWFNEEWAIKTHRALNEAKQAFVALDNANDMHALKANRGKLVHLTHRLHIDPKDVVRDPIFDLTRPNAVSVQRQVEMYQWVESIQKKKVHKKKQGKDVTEIREVVKYKKKWTNGPIDSKEFRHLEGHENDCCDSLPMPPQTFSANSVQMGIYTLSNVLTKQLTQANPISVQEITTIPQGAQKLIANNAILIPRGGAQEAQQQRALASGGGEADYLQAIDETVMRIDGEERTMFLLKATGESFSTRQKALQAAATKQVRPAASSERSMHRQSGDEPEIGDVRITFFEVPCATVSVLAKLSDYDNTLTNWQSQQGSGYDVAVLTYGTVTAADMIASRQTENTIKTWMFRFGGWLLTLLGYSMITNIVSTTADITLNWIPYLGRMTTSLIDLGVAIANLVLANSTALLVASIAWIFYRPVLGISLLIGSLGLFFGASQMGRNKGRQHPATAGAKYH